MSALLSSLSVQKKLMAPVVLLVILLIVVVIFFFRNQGVIDQTRQNMESNSVLSQEVSNLSQEANTFIKTRDGYDSLAKSFQKVMGDLQNNNLFSNAGFGAKVSEVAAQVEQINALFIDNEQIVKDMDAVVALSIKQANDYMDDMVKNLSDPVERHSVSTFERQIMGAAVAHINNNYKILLIFNKLKQDLSASDELFSYMDVLDAASDEAIVKLKGTPAMDKAVAARKANAEVRALAERFVANSTQVNELSQQIDRELNALLQDVAQLSDEGIQEVFGSFSSSQLQIIMILLVVVVIAIVLSTIFAASIVGPLKTLGQHIHALAGTGGDLTYRIDLKRKDEIGRLADGINAFLETLHSVFLGVAQNSEQIAISAGRAADLSQKTVQHMELQHRETSSVATAFNEMEGAINEIADSASNAANIVTQAVGKSDEVVATIGTTIENIDAVNRNLDEATEVIQKLNEDSQNIGQILDVIRAIADQTNLLALNAAIEAARAGEQGRGFAVVADEVRSLAQRTQDSIEEINSMISTLQQASDHASEVIVRGNDRITKTTEQSKVAGSSVEEISALVSNISNMNLQIAGAVEQQSAVTQKINETVRRISDLATESSQSANEANQSAEEQAASAAELTDLIGRFKV